MRYTKDLLKKNYTEHKRIIISKNISIDDVQPLIDCLGESVTRILLSRYESVFKEMVISEREDYETKLLVWIEGVVRKEEHGEFDDMRKAEKYNILKNELSALFN